MHKRDYQQNILHVMLLAPPCTACPLAQVHHICANGHGACPAQEAPHGGHAIRDLRSPSTIMGLKAGIMSSSRQGGT
jgi:hypothetical protein